MQAPWRTCLPTPSHGGAVSERYPCAQRRSSTPAEAETARGYNRSKQYIPFGAVSRNISRLQPPSLSALIPATSTNHGMPLTLSLLQLSSLPSQSNKARPSRCLPLSIVNRGQALSRSLISPPLPAWPRTAPAIAAAEEGAWPVTLSAPPEQPASRAPVSHLFPSRDTPSKVTPDPVEWIPPPSPDRHEGFDAPTSCGEPRRRGRVGELDHIQTKRQYL